MKTAPDPVSASDARPSPAPQGAGEGVQPDDGSNEPAAKPGMIAQLRGLYADGRELVDAEIGYQKARIAAAGRQVRTMALLAVVGLILLSCALIALVVGSMIALVPLLGAWGAMGATVVATVLMAVLCFWLAAGRVGKVSALFANDNTAEASATASGAAA